MDNQKILEQLVKIENNQNKYIYKNYLVSLEQCKQERYNSCRNEFARKYAMKHFSQSDEDGITLEICRRLGLDSESTFFEIGVGNGLENNTLVLLAMGWKGTWIGAESLAINIERAKKLSFAKQWVDKDNIVELYNMSLKRNNKSRHALVSIDVDGNDYTFTEVLLQNIKKVDVFICEYNGIFPPGAEWYMPYDKHHLDRNVDYAGHYAGASFSSLVKLFKQHDYFPVACNPMTGVNAFFVHNKYKHLFKDVPLHEEDIYVRPFYDGHIPNFYHNITPKFVESFI